MDRGASGPAGERWEAGRGYFAAIKERAKSRAKIPSNPPENVRQEDAHLASHLSKLPNKPPNSLPILHPNKRQRTNDTCRPPRAGEGPPVDTPRGPRNAAHTPVFRNYDSSIIGGFQDVVGAAGKHSSAANRQVASRVEPALSSLVAKAPATQVQGSPREMVEVREFGIRSSVVSRQAAPRDDAAMPARTAKSPAIKQEDKGDTRGAVTPKSGLLEAASQFSIENKKNDYFQRSGQTSLFEGKDVWQKKEEEAKHALLNVIDPVIDGDHKYLIKLDYRPSFRTSYLGAGPGEESVTKVAEELGVKLCNKYKTQQLHIWAEPILRKGEASSAAAKARCEHALAFLEFWRWRVLEDERKDRPSCSLVDACTWFHDLDSVEIRDWLKESGRHLDPREAPLITH